MIADRGNVAQLRPTTGIRVTRVHPINKGALVAFCDIHIEAWGLAIYDCKHFKTNKAEWIGLPSSAFTNRDGKTLYKTLVEFTDKEAAERFQRAALAAVLNFKGP
jgi:hypothetical protein